MNDSISPADLERLLDAGAAIKVFDVRKPHDRVAVEHPVPGAEWRDPHNVGEWSREIAGAGEVVVFCVHGHHVSQSVRDALIAKGVRARIVEGGVEAWCEYRSGA